MLIFSSFAMMLIDFKKKNIFFWYKVGDREFSSLWFLQQSILEHLGFPEKVVENVLFLDLTKYQVQVSHHVSFMTNRSHLRKTIKYFKSDENLCVLYVWEYSCKLIYEFRTIILLINGFRIHMRFCIRHIVNVCWFKSIYEG